MGKKKKKSATFSNSSVCDETSNSSGLLDEIIKNLRLVKESNGLIVGTNAVLRGLQRNSVDVVLLISKKASSVLYQALSLCCKNTGAVFYPLRDAYTIGLYSKVRESTTYGIKVSALTGEKNLTNLIEKINRARNSLKSKINTLSAQNMKPDGNMERDAISESKQPFLKESSITDPESIKFFLHKKHAKTNPKYSGNEESFMLLNTCDFPNYACFSNEIHINIQ